MEQPRGPSKWAQRREAKRQMYAFSTERAPTIHPVGGRGKTRAPSTYQCQKCLVYGHYTYECTGSPVYSKRPSRSELVRDPSLRPAYTLDVPPPELPTATKLIQAEVAKWREARKKQKKKEQREQKRKRGETSRSSDSSKWDSSDSSDSSSSDSSSDTCSSTDSSDSDSDSDTSSDSSEESSSDSSDSGKKKSSKKDKKKVDERKSSKESSSAHRSHKDRRPSSPKRPRGSKHEERSLALSLLAQS